MPSGTFTIHCLPMRARSLAVALLLGLAGAAAPVLAQLPAGVYKCRSDSASGFVFQGQPCPGDLGRISASATAVQAVTAPALSTRRELLVATLAAERVPVSTPAPTPVQARP